MIYFDNAATTNAFTTSAIAGLDMTYTNSNIKITEENEDYINKVKEKITATTPESTYKKIQTEMNAAKELSSTATKEVFYASGSSVLLASGEYKLVAKECVHCNFVHFSSSFFCYISLILSHY